jgi:6-phosphogluconolactonase/glucosamine-6-phosphate isomerase/deaminase
VSTLFRGLERKLIKASNRVVIIAHGLEKRKIRGNLISKEDKSDLYPVKRVIEENMAKITFFMA